jgi:hypothetical protein
MHPIYKIKNIAADGYITHGITRNAASSLPFPQLFIKVTGDAKKEQVFTFEYVVDLKKDNHIKFNWVELALDKLWYPMMNGFESKFTSSVVIRNVPAGYTVYSHSNIQVKEIENRIFTFTNTNPSHEILLMAGLNMTDKVHSQSKYNIRVTASTTTSDSLITAMFKKVERVLDLYNAKMKGMNKLKNLHLIKRNAPRTELSYNFYRTGLTVGSDMNSYSALGHEIAHHWALTSDNYQLAPWIDEGLANYMMLTTLKAVDSNACNRMIAYFEKGIKGIGAVSGTTMFSPNAFKIYYDKAAVVFWNLGKEIGEEKMYEWIRKSLKRKANNEEKLLSGLAEIAGEEVMNRFKQQLRDK